MLEKAYVGERIASLRMKKGVSAQDMSLSLGLSANYINKVELKKSYPSWEVFLNICEYFEIEPKDFFDTEITNPAQLNELIMEARGLDDETLGLMIGIARKVRK